VVVFEADGVSLENFTVCNYFGNLVWFNGGDGSGEIHLGPYHGAYLSATTTFYDSARPSSSYGLFVSNSRGPGDLTHTYAANMSDSSYYVGACPDCNTVLDDAHAEFSNLGFSGTNAGGHLLIENSEWNDNRTGIAPNSMNNDDAPPPQNGACPGRAPGPLGNGSCTIITHNLVHDNNNPNVPGYSNPGLTDLGGGSSGPVGTGIYLVGDQNDTVLDNNVYNNDAWGIMVSDRPDNESAPPASSCQGGYTSPGLEHSVCYFPAFGNEVAGNSLHANGDWGNPTNGDLADITAAHSPGNCWHDNTRPDGSAVTSDPPALQTTHATCGIPNSGDIAGPGGAEEVCAVGLAPCPFANYPQGTQVVLHPMPAQPSMPDPCSGVPENPWCAALAAHSAGVVRPASLSASATPAGIIGTPNTSASGAGGAPAIAVAIGTGMGVMVRRRRKGC
jgi:parallel beta-helix repeat protein